MSSFLLLSSLITPNPISADCIHMDVGLSTGMCVFFRTIFHSMHSFKFTISIIASLKMICLCLFSLFIPNITNLCFLSPLDHSCWQSTEGFISFFCLFVCLLPFLDKAITFLNAFSCFSFPSHFSTLCFLLFILTWDLDVHFGFYLSTFLECSDH